MESNDATHYVVVNHEQQYSIWPTSEPPAGWQIVGEQGTRDECLERIEALWTDMRPLSLREFMSAAVPVEDQVPEPDRGPDLVTRLTREQDVELELFAPASLELLRERLELGVVHVRFPETRGGTLLAVELDAATRAQAKALDPTRPLELDGTLALDFVDVRCRARIALDDLHGGGLPGRGLHGRGQLIRVP